MSGIGIESQQKLNFEAQIKDLKKDVEMNKRLLQDANVRNKELESFYEQIKREKKQEFDALVLYRENSNDSASLDPQYVDSKDFAKLIN
jgi:phage-related minor tail protein